MKILWRIVSLLLVVVMLTSCILSSTFAKYVTSSSSKASARIAKWGVEIKTDISGLFSNEYDFNADGTKDAISVDMAKIVAPGEQANYFRFETKATGTPEVACELSTTASVSFTNWEIDGVFYCPLVFTINGATVSGTQFAKAEDFEKFIEYRISLLSAEFEPGVKLGDEKGENGRLSETMYLDIEWQWPMEDTDGDRSNGYVNDDLDTIYGIRSADDNENNDPKIKFEVTQTLEQINQYDWVLDRHGDRIKFGTYPQSEVTDSKLKKTLTEMAGDLPSTGNATKGNWTSYNYYAKSEIKHYMWYQDVEYEGEKYRGVYYTEYRPSEPVSSTDREQSYQPDNGYDSKKVYWFKFDPVYWNVLSEDITNGTALVLSDMMLDAQSFDTQDERNYVQSTIRTWLKETFYNLAFSENQQSKTLATEVSEGTGDKIFLLSEEDARKYVVGKPDNSKNSTDYAKVQGIDDNLSGWWFNYIDSSNKVAYGGASSIRFNDHSDENRLGVAPALTVQLYDAVHTCVSSKLTEGENTYYSHNCTICGARLSNHKYENYTCTICGDKVYSITDVDNDNTISVGDKVQFGSYPQAEVKNESTIENLNKKTEYKLPTEDDANGWTSYRYYVNGAQADYMWYIDLDLDFDGENDYRGVYFIDCRHYNPNSSYYVGSDSGKINGYAKNTVYWFKYEPITWTIMQCDTDTVTIFSDYILDAQQFDYEPDGTSIADYAESTIRTWLNSTFYNTAFNSLDVQLIEETVLENTQDKVFLLSKADAEKDNLYMTVKQTSDYAWAQGEEYHTWWLRTNDEENRVFKVNEKDIGSFDPDITWGGVAPVLTINLTSKIHVCEDIKVDHRCDLCSKIISEHDYDVNGCKICGAPYTTEDTNNDGTIDKVTFGSYPQSDVTATLGATLNAKIGNTPTADNSNGWTSYKYYIRGSNETDFMWYIDVEVGMDKYRGVYFDQYRPYQTTLDNSTLDKVQQDNNKYYIENVYWFKYEPIQWTVMQNDGQGSYYLLSDLPLDAQEFYHAEGRTDGKDVYPNNYEYSNIRKWLNETFYNTAFNELQQQLIMITEVDNSFDSVAKSTQNPYICDNTMDKIFLPSYVDTKDGGNYGFTGASDRKRAATAYARSQGAYVSDGNSMWLLRSPSYSSGTKVSYVNGDSILKGDGSTVTFTRWSIVPAMWVKLP